MSLFPVEALLRRIRPDRNEWRYYRLSIHRDLFGGATLLRQWGRIGTAGSTRVDLYQDEGEAANALTRMIRYRKKRGYALIGG